MTFKILIGGYDGAGKSTLACSLYVYLCMTGLNVGLHEIDPWSDTHAPLLGLKSWADRKKNVGYVDADAYNAHIKPFAQDSREIVIGDVQGCYQYEHNHLWAGLADVAILVSRQPTEKDAWRAEHESRDIPGPQSREGWRQLFAANGIKTILHVDTLLDGQRQRALADPTDWYFVLRGLDRAVVPFHPGVKQLADILFQLISRQ